MSDLHPERVAELQRAHGPRQNGGEPSFDPDDPIVILNLIRDHGAKWLSQIDEGLDQLRSAIKDQEALRSRVEAVYREAKG